MDITQRRFGDGLFILVWYSGTKREMESKLKGFQKKEPHREFRTAFYKNFGGRKTYAIYARV